MRRLHGTVRRLIGPLRFDQCVVCTCRKNRRNCDGGLFLWDTDFKGGLCLLQSAETIPATMARLCRGYAARAFGTLNWLMGLPCQLAPQHFVTFSVAQWRFSGFRRRAL